MAPPSRVENRSRGQDDSQQQTEDDDAAEHLCDCIVWFSVVVYIWRPTTRQKEEDARGGLIERAKKISRARHDASEDRSEKNVMILGSMSSNADDSPLFPADEIPQMRDFSEGGRASKTRAGR